MPTPEQPSLFEEPTPQPVDTTQLAEQINAAARGVEYDDRTSEAARDQGWGPVTKPEAPIAQPSRRLADPELDAEWQAQEAAKGPLPDKPSKRPNIAAQNASERRHIAATRRKFPRSRY